MANQLATTSVVQQPRSYKYTKIASSGNGGRNLYLSYFNDYSSYQKLQVHTTQDGNCKEAYEAAKSKTSMEDQLKKQKQGSQCQMSCSFHLLRNFCFLQSFKYLLRKVKLSKSYRGVGKELTDCLCSGGSKDSKQVDAYFSVPVIPPVNI